MLSWFVTNSKFDAWKSFEVSGSVEALNQAILCTRYDGKVVVGSWFGKQSISLPAIGSYYHRSHLTLISSQVSFIPPHLSGRWDKKRRFEVAWHFIRKLQPSRLISKVVKIVSERKRKKGRNIPMTIGVGRS
jgi:threonine dehydrogenase-like Zn-dependent dehydrogenase